MHAEEAQWILPAQQGDTDAMERLIIRHAPLIQSLASRMRCEYILKDDLIQSGRIGLMRAVRAYRAESGVKLITYAVPWIIGEMKRTIRQERACPTALSVERESAGEGICLLDVLQGSSGIDLAAIDLKMALERLGGEAQFLICLRYFRNKTQKETALLLHKSQAQVSRLERQVLDALRGLLA